MRKKLDGERKLIMADYIDKSLNESPSASVRENIRARWKKIAIGHYACSFCAGEPHYGVDGYKYCPYCGAEIMEESE